MCNEALVFSNKPQGVQLEADKEYYFCMCGRSSDGLFCDGSHKVTSCTPKVFTVTKSKAYHLCRCKSSKTLPFCDGTHSMYRDDAVGKQVQEP